MAAKKQQRRGLEDDAPGSESALSRRSTLRRRLRGYDRAEVDTLLDQLGAELKSGREERAELRSRLASLEAERAEQRELESLLRDAIISAERAAREQREQMERERDAVLQDAIAEAAEIRANANARRQRVQERIAELEELEQATRERCRTLLRDGLEQIDADEYSDLPWARRTHAAQQNGSATGEASFLEALRSLGPRRRPVRSRRS